MPDDRTTDGEERWTAEELDAARKKGTEQALAMAEAEIENLRVDLRSAEQQRDAERAQGESWRRAYQGACHNAEAAETRCRSQREELRELKRGLGENMLQPYNAGLQARIEQLEVELNRERERREEVEREYQESLHLIVLDIQDVARSLTPSPEEQDRG